MAEKKYKLPPIPQSPKAKAKIGKVLREFKHKELRHGSTGKIVKDLKVAKAIAFSEARKATKRKSA